MIYPSTSARSGHFHLPRPSVRFAGEGVGGLTHPPPTAGGRPPHWNLSGGRLWPPRRVSGATGQNVGYKKNFCSLRSQIICVPTFKFV